MNRRDEGGTHYVSRTVPSPETPPDAEVTMGEEIITALRNFVDKLKSGKPIQAVRVERNETPDGTQHTQTDVTI